MFDAIKRFFRESGMLAKIMAINVIVFLLIVTSEILSNLLHVPGLNVSGTKMPLLLYWLSAPSAPLDLLLRPWTWITHMFVHQKLGHIFGNLLMLYMIGRIFCDMLNDRRFLATYIFGGLAGLVFYAIGYNIFPGLYQNSALAWGASAAVMAVVVATATKLPNYEIYLFGIIRIQLKWIGIIYVIVDYVALTGSDNLGGHLAHLGGALYGFLYATQLTKGNDWAEVMNKIVASVSSIFAPRKNVHVVHRSNGPVNKGPVKPSKSEKQQIVDSILDKISRSGYDSLSKEEKEMLLKAGED